MIAYRTIDYINHTDRDEIIRLYREIFHVDFTREYDFWYGADWAGKPVGVIAVDQETSRCVGHFTTLCFQAVIDEKQVFELVNDLRNAGAKDILVVPIERII